MDIGHIPLFEALSRRMTWLMHRQTVLAENVANANTPGYVAKDLQAPGFRALIGEAPTSGQLQLAMTQPDDIASPVQAMLGRIITVPEERSIDGNGVSLADQMMKVSSNAANYALVTTLYKDNIAMFKTVLSGG